MRNHAVIEHGNKWKSLFETRDDVSNLFSIKSLHEVSAHFALVAELPERKISPAVLVQDILVVSFKHMKKIRKSAFQFHEHRKKAQALLHLVSHKIACHLPVVELHLGAKPASPSPKFRMKNVAHAQKPHEFFVKRFNHRKAFFRIQKIGRQDKIHYILNKICPCMKVRHKNQRKRAFF